MQNAAGMSRSGDIVGRWYDAWDWNGHRYTVLKEFKKDGSGSVVEVISWRTGGAIKTAADLRWSYTGNGIWNVVESNKRTLAGSGRFSAKPFIFTARVMNRRLYDDTRRRTSVSMTDSSAVADKNLDMELVGEARAARNLQIQDLAQSLDGLRSGLQMASALKGSTAGVPQGSAHARSSGPTKFNMEGPWYPFKQVMKPGSPGMFLINGRYYDEIVLKPGDGSLARPVR